jgi:VanZ family protein
MKKLKQWYPWLILGIYWPILFVLTHLPKLPDVSVYGRDKTVHLLAFFILTLLFWFAKYGIRKPSLRNPKVYMTLLMISLYGVLDEVTQHYFIANRVGDLYDWVCDTCGALLALLVLRFLRRWVYWLILYWVGLFTLTHWPVSVTPFFQVPEYLGQYEVTWILGGYLGLTVVFWRTLCRDNQFQYNRSILLRTLVFISFYALFDILLREKMGLGIDTSDVLSRGAGIGSGVFCALLLAAHNTTVEQKSQAT